MYKEFLSPFLYMKLSSYYYMVSFKTWLGSWFLEQWLMHQRCAKNLCWKNEWIWTQMSSYTHFTSAEWVDEFSSLWSYFTFPEGIYSKSHILNFFFFWRDAYISLGGIVNYLKVRILVFRIPERITFLILFNEKNKEHPWVRVFSETRMTCT